MALQSIEEELRGLAFLNRELVNHIYNRVASIDARIRRCVLVMQESGIPKEACDVFKVMHYEERMLPLFNHICYTISEEHIPAIRGWMEDLVNQYCYATGAAVDIGWYLTYPDPSQSTNVVTPVTEQNSTVNDYALQCIALCDFSDFLVSETENLDDILSGYKNWRYRLAEDGVPVQICNNYDYMYAQPLEGAINYNLREALTEAYRYLVEMYDQIVASMNRIGLSVNRVPRALAAASYGGDASTGFTTTSNKVVPSPGKNEKDDKAVQAKEQNLKELEKYFGKPDPELKQNIAKADKQNANPHYGETDEYGVNCATCALAYVLRYCFGFNVTAKGNTKGRDNLNYWLSYGNNTFKLWKNADGTPAQPFYMMDWKKQNRKEKMEPQDYKRYFDEVCRDKGVYILTLNWKDGGGHATILQRDENGRLYHIEPQEYDRDLSDEHGRRKIDEFVDELTPDPSSITGVLRVDDKVFDIGDQAFYINEGTYRDRSGKEHPYPMTRVMDDGNHGIGERKVVKMSYCDLVEKSL